MKITSKLRNSHYTLPSLKQKLENCGTLYRAGYRNWCLSPGCDRCRRYRSKYLAEGIADWAISVRATHRMRSITGMTGPCEDARSLLDEIARRRLSLRRAYGRHQMADSRWGTYQQYATWAPVWRDGVYYGRLQGVAYLGVASEIRWAECIAPLISGALRTINTCLTRGDVVDHMRQAIDASDGLASCDPQALSAFYNEINGRGGFKALISRRGLQG